MQTPSQVLSKLTAWLPLKSPNSSHISIFCPLHQCSLSEFLMAVPLHLLISAWNSVLDSVPLNSLISVPHIRAHSTWLISSHTTHSLLCLLSGSSTSMQPHKNRNWVSLFTSALPASKTQISEAPCLSVEWINQPIKKTEAIKNQENNFKSVSTLRNALL